MLTLNPLDLSLFARVSVICGFSLDKVLLETDPEGYDTAESATYLDIETLGRLHKVALKYSRRAHFPFMLGNYFAFDHTPEMDAFLTSSASVRDILPLLKDLPLLLHPELSARHHLNGDQISIEFDLVRQGQRLESPAYIEVVVVVATRLIEQVLGEPLDFEIHFQHQPLVDPGEYQRQFHTLPRFSADRDQISFPSKYLDLKLPHRSSTLHAKAQLRLRRRIQERRQETGLVKAIAVLLSQCPSLTLKEVGERLNMGLRTLQRDLKEAGTSYSELQRMARHRLAKEMLRDPDLDIADVAQKIGFADRTSFSRAFCEWEGQSPSQYRRCAMKLVNAPPDGR